ncbi:hypothetical protein [Mycoplasmopsis cynos]|uniref:hypothetical protein n=1 Tax=Mycoplasmopsis cynos TaxID=171284 RepID=UPI002AFEE6BE|nr:hypothetical protein [Mycoplasmopsis cynos]WQQ13097.1 hypothetical protein RRG58_03990 [Mycoplasmopsis cynos]WQQ14201.1 hypothetical protein RRG52_01535 [Mycoplasmopsis cynos]WQQ17638.1 hypothetical protein RRG56_03765 [Mycoplasmopsis cynos]
MNESNFLETLLYFDNLARKNNFVYSLFAGTLKSLLKTKTASAPYEVAISLETLTTLLFIEENVNFNKKEFAAENPLPYIEYKGSKIYLNILIKSSWKKFNYWKWKNINKNIENNFFSTLNKLYSNDPDLLILIYFDQQTSSLKLKKVTNINPSYYSVININNSSFPYIDYLKNE